MKSYKQMLELHKAPSIQLTEEQEAIVMHENSFPFIAKMGMVFTSYKGHLPFIRHVLEQYRKIEDMFIVGAYDTWYIDPDVSQTHTMLPDPKMWYLAHSWVFKHNTWSGLSKRHGWLWSHYYASSILRPLKNLEYIWTSNGDCCWDRPEGVYEIIDLLGDADFMSGQSDYYGDGRPMIHSCSIVFKRDAYFSFIDYVIEKLKVSGTESYSPEMLLMNWVLEYDIKYKHAPVQPIYKTGPYEGRPDTYCEQGCESTWRDVLGFRNLIAEKNWRYNNRLPPLDKKYFDLIHSGSDLDKNTIYKFYETGDYRYVLMSWDLAPEVPREERIEAKKRNLEYYGKEPIKEKL